MHTYIDGNPYLLFFQPQIKCVKSCDRDEEYNDILRQNKFIMII